MIALLDTSEELDECEKQLGCPVEQLVTPLTRFKRQKSSDYFAIDNGAYADFNPNSFRSLLARECNAIHLDRFIWRWRRNENRNRD